jgi:hypothetical protein
VICWSSPELASASSAWFTHGVSWESLASTTPQSSPPGASNWPVIFA